MPYHRISPSNMEEGRKLLSSGKRMGIRVYSERCGACQQMAAAWEKVKKAANNSPNLTLVDVTGEAASALSRQFPILNVDGYPTVLSRKGVEYQGAREAPPMIAWLRGACGRAQSGGGTRRSSRRRVRARKATKRARRTKRRRS